MDVGHPVTLQSGACGIITSVSANGMTKVDLVGGGEVLVPFASVKNYFGSPMPRAEQTMQMKHERVNFPKLVRGRKKKST